MRVLELTPGSVTPFGLMNDTGREVTVVLDQDMLDFEWVNYHPLNNTASTTLRSADLVKFIRALGYEPRICGCRRWWKASSRNIWANASPGRHTLHHPSGHSAGVKR